MESVLEKPITKDMLIAELVQQYPSCVEILIDHGIHCVGCGAAMYETIGQGLMGHGYTDEQADAIIAELNDAIPAEHGDKEDLVVTENAARQLKGILEKQGKQGYGLRVMVTPGGCSGHQYGFDLEASEKDGDHVVEVEGVKFFIDAESREFLKGAKVDYVDALQGAGFKITNPNATKSCRCGQSFS